ncbi:MAG: hypothetical protein ABR977_00525 [Candidatus Dormibacteria bacterium]
MSAAPHLDGIGVTGAIADRGVITGRRVIAGRGVVADRGVPTGRRLTAGRADRIVLRRRPGP